MYVSSLIYHLCRNSLIIVPINRPIPLLNCFPNFTLSLVDKVTIGTFNLASVILNFPESQALNKMESSVQFNSR